MRYIQPQILRTENAALAIQSLSGVPDNAKPVGQILDFARTKNTTMNAYEADE
jgi:hypothetical protein